ncbi:hypothetical protein PHMEG_00036898 [Phytophthora megakarya]|uniref:Uncharacterized protein n=1 Tax=Phytophthora megakarya TaxID=4795 RepID=A0A225UKI3_9STRA|nr:hypothetical protein PHMEG_00036898 [Phytophthora megakarya]
MVISDDGVFKGIDASVHMSHSAVKLKRMWKEVSSNFARAEAGSNVSGQGSHDFWDFCDRRADVFYLTRWCDHRQTGREFCSANVYSDDEDDSTQDGAHNRKHQKFAKELTLGALLEKIDVLIEGENFQVQESTWREQMFFVQDQRAAQKLSTLSSRLVRNTTFAQDLMDQRRALHEEGRDAAEVGPALTQCEGKKKALEAQASDLVFEIMNGIH